MNQDAACENICFLGPLSCSTPCTTSSFIQRFVKKKPVKNLLNSDIVGINGDDGKTKFFNDNVISTIAKGPRKGVRPRQVFVIDAMQFPISESTRVRCLKGDNCIKKN